VIRSELADTSIWLGGIFGGKPSDLRAFSFYDGIYVSSGYPPANWHHSRAGNSPSFVVNTQQNEVNFPANYVILGVYLRFTWKNSKPVCQICPLFNGNDSKPPIFGAPLFFSERSERAKMIAGFWSTIASNWILEYLVSSLGCCSPHFRGVTYKTNLPDDWKCPFDPLRSLKSWRVTFPSLFQWHKEWPGTWHFVLLCFSVYVLRPQSLYDCQAPRWSFPLIDSQWLQALGTHGYQALWVPSRELTYPT